MATTTTQNHNGISLEVSEPLGVMGGVDNQLGGLIGIAPNKDPSVAYGEPIKLYTPADLALIDTTETPSGVLYFSAKYFLEVAKVPCYVIIEQEGADDDATKAKIVGGVSVWTIDRHCSLCSLPRSPNQRGGTGFSRH
ncbi:hypothetical protein [Vibrio campbellii]|uniref:hypothetical protein n=1 Tax=Vibrio campbellii TaxID=680 RepID=UPI00210BAEA7|nr:hypothetical protein [Vibrio campbellii]UTZ44842.1 hypothetical protein HB764_26670 [Vibrio campbellii]